VLSVDDVLRLAGGWPVHLSTLIPEKVKESRVIQGEDRKRSRLDSSR
jgi:hypothetical protein